MRKAISYIGMSALFFAVNLFLTYFQEDFWDFKKSFAIAGLFLIILLLLDGFALFLKRNKENKKA